MVWDRLREVVVPDSRFHLDFSMFIPDYAGSEQTIDALRSLPFYAGAGPVFVTPDEKTIVYSYTRMLSDLYLIDWR